MAFFDIWTLDFSNLHHFYRTLCGLWKWSDDEPHEILRREKSFNQQDTLTMCEVYGLVLNTDILFCFEGV